jgi:hypothetical protein
MVRLLDMTKAVNDTVLDDELSNLREYIHKETLVRLVVTVPHYINPLQSVDRRQAHGVDLSR